LEPHVDIEDILLIFRCNRLKLLEDDRICCNEK